MNFGFGKGMAAGIFTGLLIASGTAYASSLYVQALLGTSIFELNGNSVSHAPKLVYGGTTYVQLYSIQQALKQAGFTGTWNGSVFNLGTVQITPSPTVNSNIPVINSTGTDVGVSISTSALPVTIHYPDGMEVTYHQIESTSANLSIAVTITNAGTMQNGNADIFPAETKLKVGTSPSVSSVHSSSQLIGTTLTPGKSVSGTVIFNPLPTGTTAFTLKTMDFDYAAHLVNVSLS